MDIGQRCQPEGLLRQLGGCFGRTARMGACSGFLQHCRDLGRRLRRGEGQMPRSLLQVFQDAGELGVKSATTRGSELGVRGRGEQRVREPHDAVATDADDPQVDRRIEQPWRFRVDRREQRWGRRSAAAATASRRRISGGWSATRAWTSCCSDAGIDSGASAGPLRGQVNAQLEREHRVARRRLMDAGESRARDPHVEPSPNQVGEHPEAQRLEAKLAHPRLVDGAREAERIGPVAALRDDNSYRRVAEPSRREGEGAS